MYLFYQPEITSTLQLTPEEAHHASKVLRLKVGDEIQLTDGKGKLAKAHILSVNKNACQAAISEVIAQRARNFSIHLAIAPTKNNDRLEWMMEKCVEFGIEQITLMITQHSERKKINLERFRKITIAAMKQSQQVWLPLVQESSFQQLLSSNSDQKFIAHVDAANTRLLKNCVVANKSYTLLIGPEGDFTSQEVDAAQQAGFEKVSLGPTRLRTETAGLAACHILNLMNQ